MERAYVCVRPMEHGLAVPQHALVSRHKYVVSISQWHHCNLICVFSTYHNISILLHVVWLLISPAVVCGTLNQPTNGDVNLTGTTLGQRATYTCDTGYNLVGGSTRMCQATGVWSGSAPTCQSKSNNAPVIETKLENRAVPSDISCCEKVLSHAKGVACITMLRSHPPSKAVHSVGTPCLKGFQRLADLNYDQ